MSVGRTVYGVGTSILSLMWLWTSQPHAREETYNFDLPSMPAYDALNIVAEKSNSPALFPFDRVETVQANALNGTFTLYQALSKLLAGTGLRAVVTPQGAITVSVAEPPAETQRGDQDMGNSSKTVLLTTAATTVLFTSAPVRAQVEEIIVTAQKREESLQDVPLAITAIDSARLQRSGVTSPDRLEFVAPNVTFARSGADSRISIRGISSTGIEVNADPVIGMFVDGVYQSRSSQALAGFVDLERVEVLRGPQGTLYGRNTTGGSINLISKTPEDEFGFGIETVAGDYDHLGVKGFVNIPLSDTAAFRIAGLREVRDGWARNEFRADDTNNDEDQFFIRGTAQFDLGENAELTIRANYWDQGGQGSGFNAYKVIGQQESFDGAFNATNPFSGFSVQGADPNGNPDDPYTFSNDIEALRDIEQAQISAHFIYDFGGVIFTSISSYNQFDRFTRQDSDFLELDVFDVDVTQDVETFTQELQFSSDTDGVLSWVVGGFFLDDQVAESFVVRNLSDGFLTPILGPFLINRNGEADTTSYALFGQATYDLSEALRLTVGARWTRDEKSIAVENLGTVIDGSENFSRATWRAALDYDLTENALVYAYAASGFKSGGFNINRDAPYGPEKVITYELGVKQTLPGIGFLNLAGFWSEFDDLQVNSFDPETISSFLRNAAQATVKGVELEGELSNESGWALTGSLSYQNAEYDAFVVDDPFAGGVNLVDLSGRSLPRAPEFSAKLALSKDISLGDRGWLRPLVQFSYFGSNFQTEFNQPLDRQDSYTKTDLRLFWESSDAKYNAELFVTNIEDEAVLISGVYGPGQGLFANYGAPRTFGLRLGYTY